MEKKDAQRYGNVTRFCLLSRFLNKSFSPSVTSKIKEYRLKDDSLADKPDYLVVKDCIETIVEYQSETAYLDRVRGSPFVCLFIRSDGAGRFRRRSMPNQLALTLLSRAFEDVISVV